MPQRSAIFDISLASVGLVLAGAALAVALREHRPEHPESAARFLAVLDDDGDGRVSVAEYARHSDGELGFEIVDADGSGALEAWELELVLTSVSPLQPQQNLLQRVR